MKAYAVQMHLHGSMSEGAASCLAHDHMAAVTGHAEVLWWTDHDFRVSNFGKLRRATLTGLLEQIDQPNRNPEAVERVAKVPLEWTLVEGEGQGIAESSTDVRFGESGASLRFALPARGEIDAGEAGQGARRCLYELKMGARYETFPLLTRPVLRLALLPGEGVGPNGQVVIALTLSEQPPDLVNTRLTYVLGAAQEEIVRGEHGASEATIPLRFTPGVWNEYTLDPLVDVQRLGLRGGEDNSVHRVRVGVSGGRQPVEAYLGRFEMDVAHRGPAVLEMHRAMLERLPTRVRHHVGLEVSYYGRHITGFGARVPIPDYEALLPAGLTSHAVVEHIHKHGGLACLAHPPLADPTGTATLLAAQRLFGADLMEVAHAAVGLGDRLRLWDALAGLGVVVTGIGVSDAHSAKAGWSAAPGRAVAWVTRIWADSDEEPDLLEALRRGRVFFSDPSEFRGDLWLSGPEGAEMGDVIVVRGETAPPLNVRLSGARTGDLIAWYANGHLMHAETVDVSHEFEWRLAAPVDRLMAIRVELRRPSLAAHPFGGLIACTNPIYVCREAPETTHRTLEAR